MQNAHWFTMNTPAHAAINLRVVGRQSDPKLQGFIVAGAVLRGH